MNNLLFVLRTRNSYSKRKRKKAKLNKKSLHHTVSANERKVRVFLGWASR